MNLTELKKKPIGELIKIAEFMGLEGMARNRKQDIIFAILKRHAMNGEEILVTAFLKFSLMVLVLRSAAGSYLAGPDDIYVSPHKSDALTCVQVIPSQVLFALRKKVSVILRCSKLTRLTMTRQKILEIKFYLKT